MNYANNVIHDFTVSCVYLLDFQENRRKMETIFSSDSCMCLSYDVTLTKNLRGGLVFLDGHMSRSRRDVKHLKVTFVVFDAAAAAESEKKG